MLGRCLVLKVPPPRMDKDCNEMGFENRFTFTLPYKTHAIPLWRIQLKAIS